MVGRFRSALGMAVVLALLVAIVPATALALDPAAIYYADDAYEPDNTAQSAMVYDADFETTAHTLSDARDVDWTLFSAEETGQPFLVETEPTAGRDIDIEMEIFSVDTTGGPVDIANVGGKTYSDDGPWNTFGSQCYFEAPAPGDYVVRVRATATDGNGAIGAYSLTLSDGVARRIAGVDRFATAAAISKTVWPMTDLWGSYSDPAQVSEPNDPACVVIANGLNWPDALAGSALAAAADGVLLLTRPDGMPQATATELGRLMTQAYGFDPSGRGYAGMKVYILGGTGAVGQIVEDQIAAMDGVGELVRLSGVSRYDTAARIGAEFVDLIGLGAPATAFVSGGASPWDALAAGPVAAFGSAPVLLCGQSDVPTSTTEFLTDNGIERVIVVGGEASVDATAFAELEAMVSTVERVAGDTRYLTSKAVAQWGVDELGMDPGTVVLASGTSFADGLAAAPISMYTGGPLLLTKPEILVDEVYGFFEGNGLPSSGCYVVGGDAAISDEVFWEFKLGIWPYVRSLP